MESFIRELYFGNIDPQARRFEADSQYGKAMKIISENEELLTKLLKDKELHLFLDFVNAYGDLMGVASCETFVDGFRIGAAFTLDTFISKDSELIDYLREG